VTEAAPIASAVYDDPAVREALQSLISSMGARGDAGVNAGGPDRQSSACARRISDNCHAPSISGILPYIIEDVKGSTVGEEGCTLKIGG
jgi:hypothetical protein